MTREVIKVNKEKYNETYQEKIHKLIVQRCQEISKEQLKSNPLTWEETHEWEIQLQAIQQLMNEEKLPQILINN